MEPQIVFSDGYMVVESDVIFPFPRHSDWDYETLLESFAVEEEKESGELYEL